MLKKLISLIIIGVMLFNIAACSNTEEKAPSTFETSSTETPNAETPSKGTEGDGGIVSSKDILIVGVPMDPANLDPNDKSVQMVQTVKKPMYETLFAKNNDTGEIEPNLAESWKYEDDKTVTINLRKGVKFHNGDEMKASDVIFSLNRASEVSTSAPAVTMIDFDKLEAIDDYTVKLVTKDIYVPQLAYLEWPLCAIYSQRQFEETNGDFSKGGFGTGAFKLKTYVSGDRVEYEANEDYWGEGPYIKNLVMRIIPDAASRTMELETGGVDLIYDVLSTDLKRLDENPDTTVYKDLSLNTNYLFMRTDHKPFNDIRVRQAIAYAIDRDTAVQTAYGGAGVTAIGFCSPNVVDFNEDVVPYENDIEKAKQLLAEAGYPEGFKTTFHTDTGTERSALAEAIANQLGKIGIKCEIISMDPVAYQSMYARGEHNMILNGLTTTTGEGDKAFRWFHSKQPVGINFSYWINEDYDKIIDEASRTLDADARKELYGEAQVMLKDACFMVPLLHMQLRSASTSGLVGFENNISFECHDLSTVYFK